MSMYVYDEMYDEESCIYEEFEGFDAVRCGKPAVGRLGLNGGNSLCKEHFDYVRRMYNETVQPLPRSKYPQSFIKKIGELL